MDANRVFDAAIKAGAMVAREDARQRELARLRDNATRRCGGCYHWMKSRQCPKEKNVNGWNRGPSMNGPICNKFEPTAIHLEWEAKFKAAKAPTP